MTVASWPPRPRDDYHRFYPPSWMEFALCAQVDPEIFFPDKGGRAEPAKRICRACPVRAQCLDYAMGGDDFGVWGGMTERERRTLKRDMRRKVA